MLQHYKDPKYRVEDAPVGNFQDLLYYIIKPRSKPDSTAYISDVHYFLEAFNKLEEKEEKSHYITILAKNFSAIEQKWIIAIILKDLGLNVAGTAIMGALAPRALDIYLSTSSLKEVAMYLNNDEDYKMNNSLFKVCSS